MISEYPPILTGDAEHQTAQLRAYLVRLIRYIDEQGHDGTQVSVDIPRDYQVDSKIKYLMGIVKALPEIQYGDAAAGAVTFAPGFQGPPAVFVTAGTASNVTADGFTASAATKWIAVGDAARR